MKYRKLGGTGAEIGEIGYGAWGIGGTQWRGASDSESLAALQRAFELGVNFVDTALAYGDGHSEQIAGHAIRKWGREVLIATKVPPKNRKWPAPPDATLDDVFPREHILQSTETSLRNLGVDRVDLQQLHVWNPKWTPQEEWRRAFEDLKRAGKIRWAAVSLTEHDPDSGLDLIRSGCVDAVQVIYNIFDPSAANRLFPLAQELGVGILARVPLDEGGLTGAIHESTAFDANDFRAFYFRGKRKREVAERVARLQSDLTGVPGNLPQIALRFCLSHPAVTSVIPGMRRIANVETNALASEEGPLPPEILAVLARHAWPRNYYT